MNAVNAHVSSMKSLSKNHVYLLGGILLFLMIVTRAGFVNHIQDASWAVFFILGFYLRAAIALPLFLLVAFIVDISVILATGGENYCFTISYPFLAPAYGSLWLAGRWLANNYSVNVKGLLSLVLAVIVGTTVCDIFSSGGFYFFSDRFAETTFTGFMERIATYLPMYMKTTAIYVAIATAVHFAVLQILKLNPNPESESRTSLK